MIALSLYLYNYEESSMAPRKKLQNGTTLFARIEDEQYQQLRLLSFLEDKSLAAVTREAIDRHLKAKRKKLDGKKFKMGNLEVETIVVDRTRPDLSNR